MSESLPKTLDVRAMAEAGAELGGEAPLSQLPRLLELALEVQASGQLIDSAVLRWQARFDLQRVTGAADQPMLHLSLDVALPVSCQRCLSPYAQAVQVDRTFAFVADEATAEALDEDSEIDILVSSRHFDLAELIEDEVLMALPIVPMHDECPQPVVLQAGEVPDEPAKPNPFAKLAGLKLGDNKDKLH